MAKDVFKINSALLSLAILAFLSLLLSTKIYSRSRKMSPLRPHSPHYRCSSPTLPGAWPSSLPQTPVNEEPHICAFNSTCKHTLAEIVDIPPIDSQTKRDSPVSSFEGFAANFPRNPESLPLYDIDSPGSVKVSIFCMHSHHIQIVHSVT